MKTVMNHTHAGTKQMPFLTISAVMLAGMFVTQQANAAIALDRTRVIFDGESQSVSLGVSNQNKELPYLAQAWVEDENGHKIESPLTALPPLQRVEPGAKSQVKIQATQGINLLAQDKESLFYFNLREIPPKASKPNTLQIALQTRVKLFYRPKAIALDREGQANPYQNKMTLTRKGDKYIASNPTPYFITLAAASTSLTGGDIKNFKPVMVPPKGTTELNLSASSLGSSPVLTYINDYGGRPKIQFSCSGSSCAFKASKAG